MKARTAYRLHQTLDVFFIAANFANFVLNQIRASQAKGNAFIFAEIVALAALCACCVIVNTARKAWPMHKRLVGLEENIRHWTGSQRIPWLNR